VQGSRRAHLFLLVDDFSRILVHCRWVPDQNTRAGQEVLRAAIQRRGLPEQLSVDNGAPYANAALERSCAVLGIRLIHSRPYQPQGRGKQERLGRYIRERFLLEAEAQGISSFQELNDRFMAWAEQVCNTRQHAETGQTPSNASPATARSTPSSRRFCARPYAGRSCEV
jgi:putative transposase